MDKIQVLLRDKTGAPVAVKDVAPDAKRIEHNGRW